MPRGSMTMSTELSTWGWADAITPGSVKLVEILGRAWILELLAADVRDCGEHFEGEAQVSIREITDVAREDDPSSLCPLGVACHSSKHGSVWRSVELSESGSRTAPMTTGDSVRIRLQDGREWHERVMGLITSDVLAEAEASWRTDCRSDADQLRCGPRQVSGNVGMSSTVPVVLLIPTQVTLGDLIDSAVEGL